ncbi:hypothetical protein Tco_0369752 [Tanacetum coccineum]
MGQSAQTVHMLTKPQVFYDNNLKQALGFQNPFYLKKAQQIRPMLYDGNVIAKETNVISIADSEETLMVEEESRSKMLNRLSKDFGKRFVPQQELSDEQALHLISDQFASSPVKIEAPWELPKKGNGDPNTSINVNSSVAMIESVKYVEMCNKKKCVIKALKNDLRKLKGKDKVDNAAQVSNATTIAPGMYKLDPVILAPKVKNNREAHEYYLKHTMEQADILRIKCYHYCSRNNGSRYLRGSDISLAHPLSIINCMLSKLFYGIGLRLCFAPRHDGRSLLLAHQFCSLSFLVMSNSVTDQLQILWAVMVINQVGVDLLFRISVDYNLYSNVHWGYDGVFSYSLLSKVDLCNAFKKLRLGIKTDHFLE